MCVPVQAAGCNVEVTKDEAEDGEVDKLVARLLEVATQVDLTAHGHSCCLHHVSSAEAFAVPGSLTVDKLMAGWWR